MTAPIKKLLHTNGFFLGSPQQNPSLEATRDYLGVAPAQAAKWLISDCPRYAPTEVYPLNSLANDFGLGAIFLKDESTRLGLKSFKALGGSYAVGKLIHRLLQEKVNPKAKLYEVFNGLWKKEAQQFTVTTATDGNHGRAVAAGARLVGANSVVYMPHTVSQGREDIIASFGAKTVRVKGNYDDAVRKVAEDAAENGWLIVSDTSYEGYQDIPKDVMHGYGVIAAELDDAIAQSITHVFLQGGVGALAASIAVWFRDCFGEKCPKIILVEPEKAACFLESAKSGKPVAVGGDHKTLMGGLACGEVSPIAWEALYPITSAYMSITDDAIPAIMRGLKDGSLSDTPIESGETGVSALIGVLTAANDPNIRKAIGLNETSKVFIISSEGATDPDNYKKLTS